MFDNLSGLGYGIVTFAIIIGVGTVVLTKFGGSIADCATGFSYNGTVDLCQNATNVSDTATPTGGWTTVNYLGGQLGESGLAGWTPAIIALVIGMLFLGMFMARKGRTRKV